jgi:dipeptidyl aminopeptidase/acylaminoacyl peptidase
MAKFVFVLIVVLIYSSCIYGQLASRKPPLTLASSNAWTSAEAPGISNDGLYAHCTIRNEPIGSKTLLVQSTNGRWRIRLPHATEAKISNDSKRVYFMLPGDSLGCLTLGTAKVSYTLHVSSYELRNTNSGDLLVYKSNLDDELSLCNQATNLKVHVKNVNQYFFNKDASVAVLEIGLKDSLRVKSILLLDLVRNTRDELIRGESFSGLVFDHEGDAFVFLRDDKGQRGLYYYLCSSRSLKKLVASDTSLVDDKSIVDEVRNFSYDGERVFYTVRETRQNGKEHGGADLDIWSYKDAKLQSHQLSDQREASHMVCVNVKSGSRTPIENPNKHLTSPIEESSSIAVLDSSVGVQSETNWNQMALHNFSTLDLASGTERNVAKQTRYFYNVSPGGKYLIYYDPLEEDYFSYNVQSREVINITRTIVTTWLHNDRPGLPYNLYDIAGWLSGDSAILIYDVSDLWLVDPSGSTNPKNITNGYGKRNKISLRVAEDFDKGVLHFGDFEREILFVGFNNRTKQNGYYSKNLSSLDDPQLLVMDDNFYYWPGMDGGEKPLKAKSGNGYVIKRMSSSQSPNFFYTKNFKSYVPISNVYPERLYNWYKTELHTWRSLDGSLLQGILYKPEDFDSTKSYPVIFTYYEKVSNKLNVYIKAEHSTGELNIAWYVSNGYLVFTPDIDFIIGKPGESFYKSVVSAAEYLKKKSWVDASRMGLQGFSFGGFATGYLVANTNIFAAACASSGVYDFVSGYGSLFGDGNSEQHLYEMGQCRIGLPLAMAPDLYISNSAIFKAHQVTTPLLMMHSKNDDRCPFSNAIEFFTSLRRFGKKAWLLQYDDGGHSLFGRSAIDFTTRMSQFFDYYLKGYPPPVWMTAGRKAIEKSTLQALEIDSIGNP